MAGTLRGYLTARQGVSQLAPWFAKSRLLPSGGGRQHTTNARSAVPPPNSYQATRKRRSARPQSTIAGGFTRHCSFWASPRRFTAYVLHGRRGKWSYQNHGRFWYYLACSMWYPGGKSGMIWPAILRIQRGEQTTCLTREDARRVQGVGFFPNAPRLPCWSHVGSRLAEAQKKGCS